MNGDQNPVTPPPAGWQFNPGDTVTPAPTQPAAASAPQVQSVAQESVVPSPALQPEVTPLPASQDSETPVSGTRMQDPAATASNDQQTDDVSLAPVGDQISWTASEYIAHQKGSMWYVTLVAVSVLTAGIIYILTKDIISGVSILLIALVFGLSAARKPRVLEYSLDNRGLTIAQKSYPYGVFRSFAVIDEGAFSSIVFIPLKRFMPVLTIYYAPEDENEVVATIADHLPMEQRKRDAIDTLLHKIRF